jgi:hypothetical protein
MPTYVITPAVTFGGAFGGVVSWSGEGEEVPFTDVLRVSDGDATWFWFDTDAANGYGLEVLFDAVDIVGTISSVTLTTRLRATAAGSFTTGLNGTPLVNFGWFDPVSSSEVAVEATDSSGITAYTTFEKTLDPAMFTAEMFASGLAGFYYAGTHSVDYGHIYTYSALTVVTEDAPATPVRRRRIRAYPRDR